MKRYTYSHNEEHESFAPGDGFDTISEAIDAAEAHPERPKYIIDRHEEYHTLAAWRDSEGTWEHSEDYRYEDD